MKPSILPLMLFALFALSVFTGCAPARITSVESGGKKTGMPEGPVRLTTVLRVAADYKQYVTRISDEAEKYRMKGYIWEQDTQRMKLVIEGERDKVDKFFDRVIEIGRVSGKLGKYDMPKWSDATGKCGRFIWVFGDKPPGK